jgi:hypothetical protein
MMLGSHFSLPREGEGGVGVFGAGGNPRTPVTLTQPFPLRERALPEVSL